MKNKFLEEIKTIDHEQVSSELEERLKYAYLEIGNVNKIRIENPLMTDDFENKDMFLENFAQFLRNPANMWFACKYILNVNLLPFQLAILYELWTKPFPMLLGSRGMSKTYIITIYCMLKAIFDQSSKIVVVGAALRHSMLLYNYLQAIWDNAPVLQDICGGKKSMPKRDLHMCLWKCGTSEMRFLPMGNGETIRGQRASVIVADEFQSIDPIVFETVVRGFAAVKTQDLVGNVENEFRMREMEKMGLIKNDLKEFEDHRIVTSTNLGCNQLILSGTTTFQFNHLYKYYRYYKAIIESNGDTKFLKENYHDIFIPEEVNPKDYSVIRIPYDLVPPGMMDKAILSQGRATMNSVIFDMEYGCIFPKDSDGFFPASVLYACTCPLNTNDGEINFTAMLHHGFGTRCIMGIDPASEQDKFAVCIVEDHSSHGRIIYQWSTNRKQYQELKDKDLIDKNINDYHTFCIKHVRSLCRRFRIEMIVCDAGGGGVHLREGLKDLDKLGDGEKPIYDMDDETTLGQDGAYILKMINFQDTNWKKEAHYGLKKDFSDRKILFPKLDAVTLIEAETTTNEIKYEDLEKICLEIEELRHELMLIKHDMSPNGTERWDVPRLQVAGADSLKKMLRRDRFTSLLLANWGRRLLTQEMNNQIGYMMVGSSTKSRGTAERGEIKYMNSQARRLRTIGENNIGGGYDSIRRFDK